MVRFVTDRSQCTIFNLNNIQYMYIAPNHTICGVYNGETLVIDSFDTEEDAKQAMRSLIAWLNLPDDRAKSIFRMG